MRLKGALGVLRHEIHLLQEGARTGGGRNAVVGRARSLLRVDQVESVVDRLEPEMLRTHGELNARMVDLAGGIEALHGETTRSAAELIQHMEHGFAQRDITTGEVVSRLHRLDEVLAGLQAQTEQLALDHRVNRVTSWVTGTALANEPLISVVLATRNRCDRLARAIASVQGQAYRNWELIVIDDGSTDGTQELLAQLTAADRRISALSTPARGVAAARNAGLRAATGEFVCYLDDDNLMTPMWLKAVAWQVSRRPDLDVLYGARLVDAETNSDYDHPVLHMERFDRNRLEAGNYIDLGTLAHRRELDEAVFDEDLQALVDWDLILRLTTARAPVEVPVVAVHYETDAPNRISRARHYAVSEERIRTKMRQARPLRVLGHNSLFPLTPETYVGEEMQALADNGVELAWSCDKWTPSSARVEQTLYRSLGQAVTEFRPDLLMVFWATFAEATIANLEEAGIPFGVRVHSFDFDPDRVARLLEHPLCIGAWCYPHHAARVPGARSLVPLLTGTDAYRDAGRDRRIVLSASAALPKKDWPTVIAAFAELAMEGVDCRIIVGVTHAEEHMPGEIRRLIAETGAPVMLSVDVPHDQVAELLGRTAVVLYSKIPVGEMGMPRSIIEGMFAGASVIVPDRIESTYVAGEGCRTYRTSADIVRHAREVLAGGPAVEAERVANQRLAFERFADPALGAAFTNEVSQALAEWRARQGQARP
ncbi:MAG TPA: glycosyltransferase [Acidimicrobiales bacterium]|jgi:glycosyltransferase involved in cell wall biosynthesis|nr:glycosyltransferase [Acidimicrobiales bacterium]